jgi:hypothetical protein
MENTEISSETELLIKEFHEKTIPDFEKFIKTGNNS